MGRKRVLHGNDRVVESNAIARAQLAPPAESVWEERIIAQVAAYIKQNDGEFPETAFMVGQLIDTKKVSTSQLRGIEKASQRLVGTTFKLNHGRDFTIYSVFSFIKFEDGIISAKLNQDLKPHYLMLKQQFAVRSLPEFRQLNSVYSQQMFRILNSWAGLKEVIVPLEDLIHGTNPPASIREFYKNFKVRVLEVAHKEINEKTNLKFDWEPVKTKNKVTEIRFIFK